MNVLGSGAWDPGVGSWELCLLIYVAGVALGLLMIDARPLTRMSLAILWPLGPLAFLVTISILLVASLIAFPIVGVVVLILGALSWRLFG